MIDAKMFMEKRVHPRISVKLPVQFRLTEDERELQSIEEWRKTAKPAEIMDLSLGGMYVAVDQQLTLNSLLRFNIFLPPKVKPLVVYAEVVWANVTGAGLRFVMIRPEDLETLKNYLDKTISLKDQVVS